ncbi:tRNA (adenosine(37)-N6)-threonylcarbamoyltransferase complex ATPase subunit type 1 TsaE [Arthrobacter sp. JSM 101049]|uniref:tRNA (adenosine(37)-N6)-threonylcarbamoyltransferase complex ATPase subunit type 1 TsaE n=1 Tax=Arthrobacter sp. JSM 101049 TaxID=929097 RepID=UPI00356B5076
MSDTSTTPVWTAELSTPDAQATRALAARIGAGLRSGDLVLLNGELGAGKTTFTQGLGVGLGVREGIISPTFVLSRIHPSLSGGPDLVHVDAYRLADAGELEDLDLEQDLDTSVTVVEWGTGKAEQLSASRLEITLVRDTGSTMAEQGGEPVLDFSETDVDEPRSIAIAAFGTRWKDQRPF